MVELSHPTFSTTSIHQWFFFLFVLHFLIKARHAFLPLCLFFPHLVGDPAEDVDVDDDDDAKEERQLQSASRNSTPPPSYTPPPPPVSPTVSAPPGAPPSVSGVVVGTTVQAPPSPSPTPSSSALVAEEQSPSRSPLSTITGLTGTGPGRGGDPEKSVLS